MTPEELAELRERADWWANGDYGNVRDLARLAAKAEREVERLRGICDSAATALSEDPSSAKHVVIMLLRGIGVDEAHIARWQHAGLLPKETFR